MIGGDHIAILLCGLAFPVVLGGHWGRTPAPSWTNFEQWMQWYRDHFSIHNENQTRDNTASNTEPRVIHEWASVEYDWPCDYVKQFYVERGWFDPKVNLFAGIDVYHDDVYVTVLRFFEGVPSGLNKIVRKNGKSLLQPFPSLSLNEVGKCSNLQFPFSSETDPATGYMYVLDVGNVGNPFTRTGSEVLPCPSKIVVLDLNNAGAVLRSYDLPESVVPRAKSAVNDLVLDRITKDGARIRYAYISDPGEGKLIVFDFDTSQTWSFKHDSMKADEGRNITINGITTTLDIAIDGIAVDANFEYVYYCAIGSVKLYQIPTSVLRDPNGNFAANVRLVGSKLSQTDGLIVGQESLFYGVETMNAVYKWEIAKDMADQKVDQGQVTLSTESVVAPRDDEKFQWVDSLAIDHRGYLWFTTNRIHLFLFGPPLDFTGASGSNFRVNRVYVGEKSYLWREAKDCMGLLCRLL